MSIAVGMVETLGFPAVVEAADAMVKGGRVTIVYCDKAERGEFLVAVRGPTSEVKQAMTAGLEAAETTMGGKVVSHYTVPNPPENAVSVLPIDFSESQPNFH